MKSYDVTIQMKALCLYSHMVLFVFSKFHKMKFGHLVEICFWLNLAVKGLNKPTRWLTSDANDLVNTIKAMRERNLSLQGSLGDKQIRDCLVPRQSRSLLWRYCPFTTPGHALRLSPAPRVEVQTPCVAQYYCGTLLMITGDYSSVAKLSLISQSINQSINQSVSPSISQSKYPPERARRGKRARKLACIKKRARDDDMFV